jgi:hypothetical protein
VGKGQTTVLIVSGILGAIGALWIADAMYLDGELRVGNPVGASEFERGEPPRRVRAEVVRSTGESGVRVGAICEFLVQRVPLPNPDETSGKQRYYCNAQVSCGGTLVYGGPDRGFFPCVLHVGTQRHVVGADASTTRDDHDAAMKLDTPAGLLKVWDDRFGTLGEFEIVADVIQVE